MKGSVKRKFFTAFPGGIFLFFSLTELLIVFCSLALFSTLIIPFSLRFRSVMKTTLCKDSLLTLTRANIRLAETTGYYISASKGKYTRWFGGRLSENENFSWNGSPLFDYTPREKKHKLHCPAMISLLDSNMENTLDQNYGFGYGYNENIGTQRAINQPFRESGTETPLSLSQVKDPEETVMFADTATKVDLYGKRKPKGLWAMFPYIRSHALMSNGKDQWGTPIPSVHFRHKGTANVSWGDGHITQEPLETSKGEWGKYGIGCLGTDNDHELIP